MINFKYSYLNGYRKNLANKKKRLKILRWRSLQHTKQNTVKEK